VASFLIWGRGGSEYATRGGKRDVGGTHWSATSQRGKALLDLVRGKTGLVVLFNSSGGKEKEEATGQ